MLSAIRLPEDLVEQLQIARGKLSASAHASCALLATSHELCHDRLVLERIDGSSDLAWFLWIEIDGRIAGDLGQAGDPAAQDGSAARHRFDDWHAESLVQRRKDQRRTGMHEASKLVLVDVAREHDQL